MADQMESVRERCALIDNATNEAREWQDRCMAIGEYVCEYMQPQDKSRADIMDIINNRKRTRHEQMEDARNFLVKLYAARDYVIRIREEAGYRPNFEAHLRAANMWPPPMTERGDIE